MASAFTHAFVAIVIGKAGKPAAPLKFWLLMAACSILPDADVIGFGLGIPYSHPLGHRGFTHSLCFAAFLAWLVLEVFFRGEKRFSRSWWGGWSCLFAATASHGVLDALTNGGLGVAFFWPLDNTRYFFPFQPVQVSPISVARFFDGRAWPVLKSEILWVWIPCALLLMIYKTGWRKNRGIHPPN